MGIQFSEQRGRKKKRLGDILVSEGVITVEQLEEALEKEAAEKGTNFSNLVRMILVEREKDKQK